MRKYSYLILLFFIISSCKKEEILRYKQDAAIFFLRNETKYSFIEFPNKIDEGYDYLDIPVQISGNITDYDRSFDVVFAEEDTLHTIEEGMLEIVECIVPSGEFQGRMTVKINYSKKLDDSIYVARIKIVPNNLFPVANLNVKNYSVSFGNIITEPENWSYLNFYFGKYSKSWYKFILKAAEVNSLPYKYALGVNASEPDAERWPLTLYEIIAYASKVRAAFNKYNDANAPNYMIHEDGEYKDQLVQMGNF